MSSEIVWENSKNHFDVAALGRAVARNATASVVCKEPVAHTNGVTTIRVTTSHTTTALLLTKNELSDVRANVVPAWSWSGTTINRGGTNQTVAALVANAQIELLISSSTNTLTVRQNGVSVVNEQSLPLTFPLHFAAFVPNGQSISGTMHTAAASRVLYPTPGLDDPKQQHRKLRDFLTRNVPSTRKLNIVIMGKLGGGKTSLLNVIHSAFTDDDEPESVHISHGVSNGHDSTHLESVKVPGSGVVVTSTWGWTADNFSEGRLQLILDGMVHDGYGMQDHPRVRGNPDEQDEVHGVIFCVGCDEIDETCSFKQRLEHFRCIVRQRGIPCVVALNKVDMLPHASANLMADLFTEAKVADAVWATSRATGFNTNDIFPCKTYTEERQRSELLEVHVLQCLKKVVKNALARMPPMQPPLDREGEVQVRVQPSS